MAKRIKEERQPMAKIFVLDTSAIISLVQDVTTVRDHTLPGFAGVLGDNEIIIPRVVLDELELMKEEKGEKSFIANEVARQLDHYAGRGSLIKGVETEKGGLLRIAARPKKDRLAGWGFRAYGPSNEVIATAVELQEQIDEEFGRSKSEKKEAAQVILISQDRILRVIARSIGGIKSEELKSVCAAELDYEPGYQRLILAPEKLDQVIAQGFYELPEVPHINEFFHLVDRENPEQRYVYAMAREVQGRRVTLIDRGKVDFLKVSGEVSGRNVRQKLLLWALMGCGEPDPMAVGGVRMITISGPAGSGKSFLSLAAAWERIERGHFERIIITRPMVDVGTSMGYLPGTLEEKIRPWGGPVEDNLRAIVPVPSPEEGRKKGGAFRAPAKAFDAKAWLEMENRLEIVPLTYVRGRTFRRCFVMLEEAQNLERGPLKVLLTRLGEGSVVVVIGDPSQIDNQFLSRRNNGLVHAINAFRNWPQAVHLHLRDIVRSDMAQAATELL